MSSSTERFARTAERVAARQDSRAARLAAEVRDFVRPRGDERALDVGTGAGALAFALAPDVREVVGLDPVPELLELARERALSNTEFVEGDGAALPFPDASFDLAGTHRTLHHVPRPDSVVAELARVTRPGGRVVASLFAAPERSQGTVAHEAMSALIPSERAGDHAPYALSDPGNLEASLVSAGLTLDGSGEVVCPWRYADMDEAIRALLCSAGGARAAEAAGPQAVRDALRPALARFQDPETGTVTLRNTFRWAAASQR